RRHTRSKRDWSSDVCSSDLIGRELRAFETPFGRAGFLICNDRWNPMIARTVVLDGARILLIPSYGSKRKSQNEAVLARARENGEIGRASCRERGEMRVGAGS